MNDTAYFTRVCSRAKCGKVDQVPAGRNYGTKYCSPRCAALDRPAQSWSEARRKAANERRATREDDLARMTRAECFKAGYRKGFLKARASYDWVKNLRGLSRALKRPRARNPQVEA